MAQILTSIYNDILDILQEYLIVSKDTLEIGNNVVICDERSFEGWFSGSELDPTTIYVIVSFESGSIWLDNTVVPVSIKAYSEQNSFENCRTLLTYIAGKYNFASRTTENAHIIQSYSTPLMDEEFVEEGSNYRAIFTMDATFVYGENISKVEDLEIDNEDVIFLNFECSFNANPSTVNKGNNEDRTTTLNKSGTFSCAISIPSVANSSLVSKLDGLMFGTTNINTTFTLTFTKNGTTYTKVLHFIDIEYSQEITGMPMYVVGFGE